MNVAVVDVGSNTVRLLVARRERSGLLPLDEGREHLFLGEDVERDGRLSAARIDEAAECVAGFVHTARGLNASAGHRGFEYGAETMLELGADEDAAFDALGEKTVTLKISKNRHGDTGKKIALKFHGGYQRFREA